MDIELFTTDGPTASQRPSIPDDPEDSALYGPIIDAEDTVDSMGDAELIATYYLLDEQWPHIDINGVADYSATISELRRRGYETELVGGDGYVTKHGDVVRPELAD